MIKRSITLNFNKNQNLMEPTVNLKTEITDPTELVNAYTKKYKCMNFWGVFWNFLALLIDVAMPWWIRYYLLDVGQSDETKAKVYNLIYLLPFYTSFTVWIRDTIYSRFGEGVG
jgi:hypothetical protein